MKSFILACFVLCQFTVIQALEIQTATDHFQLFAESHEAITNDLLEEIEASYFKNSVDFDFIPNEKIQINLFSDLTDFHQSIGWNNAPDWVVARTLVGVIDIVSPQNPGPYHTEKSIKRILLLNIAKSFIYQKYGSSCASFWFVFGVASNQVDQTVIVQLPKVLPTLQQLEEADTKTFSKIGGFQIAHHLSAFIKQTYGWEKTLQLLASDDDFEAILGISKEDLYNKWVYSVEWLVSVV